MEAHHDQGYGEVRRPAPASARRALFIAAALLVGLAAAEVLSWLAYLAYHGRVYAYSGEAARRGAAGAMAGDQATPESLADQTLRPFLHPYLGFIAHGEPGQGGGQNPLVTWVRPLSRGGAPRFPPEDQREDTVVVVISGGSVAGGLMSQLPHLTRQLAQIPQLAGKQFRYHCLASVGHKQPQQLLALAYYLALGGRLDLLINIDGFNEAIIGETLANAGLHPSLPLHWSEMVRGMGEGAGVEQALRLASKVILLVDLRRGLARLADLARFSVTAGLAWSLADDLLARRINGARRAWLAGRPRAATPPAQSPVPADLHTYIARLWQSSAARMAGLAAADGFSMFHFLQPNLHLPGAKQRYTRQEMALMQTAEGKSFGKLVLQAYPILREIARQGPLPTGGHYFFSDLSYLFRDVDQTVFEDPCCHLTPGGYALMAEAVGQQIRSRWPAARPAPAAPAPPQEQPPASAGHPR